MKRETGRVVEELPGHGAADGAQEARNRDALHSAQRRLERQPGREDRAMTTWEYPYTDWQGHTYNYCPVVEICHGQHDGAIGFILRSYEEGTADILAPDGSIINLPCGQYLLRGVVGPEALPLVPD